MWIRRYYPVLDTTAWSHPASVSDEYVSAVVGDIERSKAWQLLISTDRLVVAHLLASRDHLWILHKKEQ